MAISPSSLASVFCFDLENQKIIVFNFEVQAIIDNYLYPFDYSILQKILQLDTNLKPISTNYFVDLKFFAGSKFLYDKNTIFEEISIAHPKLSNIKTFDLSSMLFSKLYYALDSSIETVGISMFMRYIIEIKIPFNSNFFWYKRYDQKFPEPNGATFRNIY